MAANTWAVQSPGPSTEWLPALDVPEPGSQRRLTVLLRWLLLVPHFVVLWLLSILAFFVVVIGWFGALVLGRLPQFAADYLTGYLGYATRVGASSMLLVDAYPPFALSAVVDYPVRIEVRPGPLNRLAVFFRLLLVFPAAIVSSLLSTGWYTASFVVWLVVLVLGRMPRPLFEATAAVLRFTLRVDAYMLLLTSAYPKRVFGDDTGTAPAEAVSATRPLLLSGGGKLLVALFLAIGLISNIASSVTTSNSGDTTTTTVTTIH